MACSGSRFRIGVFAFIPSQRVKRPQKLFPNRVQTEKIDLQPARCDFKGAVAAPHQLPLDLGARVGAVLLRPVNKKLLGKRRGYTTMQSISVTYTRTHRICTILTLAS